MLDQSGQKMSKRLGNVVQGLDLLRNNSADVGRFYLLSKASPEDSVNFDAKEMAGRPYQVLNTLYHLHLYLQQNGDADGYEPGRNTLAWASKRGALTLVDNWLLRKLSAAEGEVRRSYSAGRYNEAAKALEELVISHLSQTYVRLVRGELWSDDPRGRGRRLTVYAVLGYALAKADELLHPIAPFATEFLHQEVFAGGRWAEPLLAEGSTPETKRGSESAESAVDFALKVEEAANAARAKAKLKRRWPLRQAVVLAEPSATAVAKRAKGTAALLCNVKGLSLVTDVGSFPAAIALSVNRSRLGALFKEKTREVLSKLEAPKGAAALRGYLSGKGVKAGEFDVPLSCFELSVAPDEGFEVAEKGGVFVAVPKERDRKLVAEGLVRDLARRLQALRKEKGFVPTAMLASASVAGLEEEDQELVKPLLGQMAYLVRAKSVRLLPSKSGGGWSESELDGRPLFLKVG